MVDAGGELTRRASRPARPQGVAGRGLAGGTTSVRSFRRCLCERRLDQGQRIVRLIVSVPDRATQVSEYVPGRRICFRSRRRTMFAPALTRSFQVWSRRCFALRSVTVICAGFETLIRTAKVVAFFRVIRSSRRWRMQAASAVR